MKELATLDYISIVVYMTFMAVIGLFLGRYVKNIGDYFKGGNAIPWVSAGISNFMTMFSTFIFVAYAGIAYEDGLIALTLIWCTVPPALVAAGVFAKRWRRAGLSSPVEFLETRFNSSVRQLFSWSGVAFKILDNMVRLYAIGLFISSATPISLQAAVIFCGLVVIVYTAVGGLWAVVVTDTVQFVMLMFITLILVPLSLEAAGGLANLRATIPENFLWTNGDKGKFWYLTAYYVMILIKYNGNWAFIQRFYSVRDEASGQKLGLLTAVLFMVSPFIFLLPSIAAKVVIPGLENPEMAYVSMSLRLLPEGIMGLMIAAMFAATMSSLSSEYNVTAGVLTQDIYQRIFNRQATPGKTLQVARIMTVALGLMVTLGALYIEGFGGAFEANKLFTGLFGIPMVIPLIFGILWKHPRPWGAWVTILSGIALGIVLNAHPEIPWETATLVQIGWSVGIFLLSGWAGKNEPAYEQRISAFFQKLQTPLIPGPVADHSFQRAQIILYTTSLAITGLLFAAMSVPSLTSFSGKLTLGAGLICLFAAAILLFRKNEMLFRGKAPGKEKGVSSDSVKNKSSYQYERTDR